MHQALLWPREAFLAYGGLYDRFHDHCIPKLACFCSLFTIADLITQEAR